MGLYAYALVPSPAPARLGGGAAGEPLRRVSLHRMTVIAGERARAPAPTAAALRRQARVVQRIARASKATLPFRFGAFAASPAELRSSLTGRASALRRALSRVRGCVQMNVRFEAPAPKAPTRLEGRRYLAAKAAARRPAELTPLSEALSNVIRAERLSRRGRAVTLHHLISAERVRDYRAVWRLAAAKALRPRVSGPFPPFAFGAVE